MGGVEGYVADGYGGDIITDDILEADDVDVLMGNPKRDADEAGFIDAPEYTQDVVDLTALPELPPQDALEVIDLTVDDRDFPLPIYGPDPKPIDIYRRSKWSRDMLPEYRAKQFKAAARGDIKEAKINKRRADAIEARQKILNRHRAEDLFARELRASQAEADQAISVMPESALSALEGGGIGPRVIPEGVIDGLPAEIDAAIARYSEATLRDAFDELVLGRPAKMRVVDGQTVGVWSVSDLDQAVRRIQGGRNWGGVSGRSYRGTIDNPLSGGTVDVYDGAAVSSGVNIPGINMDRPTPQPAQPATYGVEAPQSAEVDPDLIQSVLPHGQYDTFFGKSVRVASDWQKEAAMRNFMGSDFIEKPGLYANM